MRFINFGLGIVSWALALMIQIPSDNNTYAFSTLATWFRDAGLSNIADYLNSAPVNFAVRQYAVWMLFFIGVVCFVWPLMFTSITWYTRKQTAIVRPDMKISDAIDYIMKDSKTKFDKPHRPPAPRDLPTGMRMQIVNTLPAQAQQKLQGKINTGDIKAWGLRR